MHNIILAMSSKSEQSLLVSVLEVLDGSLNLYCVNTGEDAILQYKKIKPSLVVMDAKMPDRDGLYYMKEILSFDQDAKCIIATSTYSEDHQEEIISSGAVDIVMKPIQPGVLLDKIKKYLSSINKENSINYEEADTNNKAIQQDIKTNFSSKNTESSLVSEAPIANDEFTNQDKSTLNEDIINNSKSEVGVPTFNNKNNSNKGSKKETIKFNDDSSESLDAFNDNKLLDMEMQAEDLISNKALPEDKTDSDIINPFDDDICIDDKHNYEDVSSRTHNFNSYDLNIDFQDKLNESIDLTERKDNKKNIKKQTEEKDFKISIRPPRKKLDKPVSKMIKEKEKKEINNMGEPVLGKKIEDMIPNKEQDMSFPEKFIKGIESFISELKE